MKAYSWGNVVNSMPTAETWVKHSDALAAIEQARREEREACALLCERVARSASAYFASMGSAGMGADPSTAKDLAAAIRARGEVPTWTAEQVSHVSTEADRLADKFSRGEGNLIQSQQQLPTDMADVMRKSGDSLIDRGEGK